MPSLLATSAIAAGILALTLRPYAQRLPYPYDDTDVDVPSPALLDALPGNAKGSPFPPVFEGAWAANDRLRAAKRLFEGQVVGSESAAAGAAIAPRREGIYRP